MYSISNAVVSYTPGSGYTAAIPGCSVKIRWGEEFLAEMKAKRQSASSAGNAEKTETAPRKELSKADIAELAAKYNPNKMSQEEFDAFLEDLEKRGALSRDDMGRLGYQGAVVSQVCGDGSLFLSSGSFSIIDRKDLPGHNPFNLYHSLADAGGDVLAWAKIQEILEHQTVTYTEQSGAVKSTGSTFSALLDALEAIQSQRSR